MASFLNYKNNDRHRRPQWPHEPPIGPESTPAQRWRFRRNLVIYIAHRQGLSQRILADVFDLPRSRIAEIIREIAQLEQRRARRGPGSESCSDSGLNPVSPSGRNRGSRAREGRPLPY